MEARNPTLAILLGSKVLLHHRVGIRQGLKDGYSQQLILDYKFIIPSTGNTTLYGLTLAIARNSKQSPDLTVEIARWGRGGPIKVL